MHGPGLALPPLYLVRQHFSPHPDVEVERSIAEQLSGLSRIFPARIGEGGRVAVAVGSRGISRLPAVVKCVVEQLKAMGLSPFVTPAMGSHGGATAEGQLQVLAHRGITGQSVGAPLEASMDVVQLGEVDGIKIHVDRLAHEADGIVIINRVKPHTHFTASLESGLTKMLVIGLGNRKGAEHVHAMAVRLGLFEVIQKAALYMLDRLPVIFGVALVEDRRHRLAHIECIPTARLQEEERKLLKLAYRYHPKIPFNALDLLIVDWMGKDISGVGMDPKVIGRLATRTDKAHGSRSPYRLFVRNLTDASLGSAIGVGMADFVTKRLVDKIDLQAMAANCLTAGNPEEGRIPLAFENDRQALTAALATLPSKSLQQLRIARIKSTFDLEQLVVSKACLEDLPMGRDLSVVAGNLAWTLDSTGNLPELDSLPQLKETSLADGCDSSETTQ